MPGGKPAARLECSPGAGELSGGLRGEGGFVEITVADTGCGMSPEQQESLFRADREVQGDHGFGLILCRYIIKKHDDLTRRGCKLWVESTPGQGTTMHALLATNL